MVINVDISIASSEEEEDMEQTDQNFTIHEVSGGGHCMLHCFSKNVDEPSAHVLNRLWNEINDNVYTYIEFGSYNSANELRKELSKYACEKSYDNDTADLVVEALSRVFEYKVLIRN